MDDINILCETMKSDVNWDMFFTIVRNIGDDLNGRKDRFDKSDLFEYSLEECSQKCVKWVDEIGWDHEVEC